MLYDFNITPRLFEPDTYASLVEVPISSPLTGTWDVPDSWSSCPACMPDQSDGTPWVLLQDLTASAHQLSVAKVTDDGTGTMSWTDHTLIWDEATYSAYSGYPEICDWEKNGDFIRVLWKDQTSDNLYYFQIDLNGGGTPIIKRHTVFSLTYNAHNTCKFLYESDTDITFIWIDNYQKQGQSRSVAQWATWNGSTMSAETDLELKDDSISIATIWKCKCTGFVNEWHIGYNQYDDIATTTYFRLWHVDTSTSSFISLNFSALYSYGTSTYKYHNQAHVEYLLSGSTYYAFFDGWSNPLIRVKYTTDPAVVTIETSSSAEVSIGQVVTIERDDTAGTLKVCTLYKAGSTTRIWWSIDVDVSVWDGLGAEWTEYTNSPSPFKDVHNIIRVSNMGYETTIDTTTFDYVSTWTTWQWFRNVNFDSAFASALDTTAIFASMWDYGVTRYHIDPTWYDALGSKASSTYWYIAASTATQFNYPAATDDRDSTAVFLEQYTQGSFWDGTGTNFGYPRSISSSTGDLLSKGQSIWGDSGTIDGQTYGPGYKDIYTVSAGHGAHAILYDPGGSQTGTFLSAQSADQGGTTTKFKYIAAYAKHTQYDRLLHMIWEDNDTLYIFSVYEPDVGEGNIQVDKYVWSTNTLTTATAAVELGTYTALTSIRDLVVVQVPEEDAYHVIFSAYDAPDWNTDIWEWTPSTESWASTTTPVHHFTQELSLWTNEDMVDVYRWESVGAEKWLLFPLRLYGQFTLLKATAPNYSSMTEIHYAGSSSDFEIDGSPTATEGQVFVVKGAEAWVTCTWLSGEGRDAGADAQRVVPYVNSARLDITGGTPRWTGWVRGNTVYDNNDLFSGDASIGSMGAFAFPALTDNMYAYASKSGGLAIAYAHWTVFRADMWDAFTIDMNLTAVIDPVATFVGGMTMSANFASASNPTVTFSGQTIMSASFSSANVLTATYTNVKNVVRKFMQAWTIGDKRKITHEEYIVGTDFYTDQLTLVNNLRAAEGVGGGKTPLNNILDNGAAYALARDWNKFTVRQQVVHNPATLVHYDPSFDVEWQTRESQLDAVWTYDVDQPAFFADNLAALVFGDPYENTALWYSDWFYTQWYNSPPHKAWMLYDWTGNGSDASKVFLGGMGLDWSHSYAPAADDPAAIGTQIHYDFSTSYLDDEMERTWNSEYSVVGAELIAFYGEYSTVAWKDIQGQFSFPYALRIATQHSFNYGARTARQIAFPTHYTVTTQIGLPYTGLEPIRAQIGYPYDLKNAVAVKQIGFPYSSHVESILSLPYGDRLQSISQIAFPYSLMPQVTKQIGLPYEGTDPIAAQHGFVYDLLVNNPVISDIALSYALIDDTVINSPDQATVTVGGVTIPVTRADVSISEEDFVWKASVTLAGMSDYNMFVQDDPFQVHIGTDTYEMVVDEKSLSRGEDTNANVNIAVVGLSPAIQYKAPRADVIDFELTTATMAKDVVEGILGTTVQWNVQNWMIPAYRLSATEISPIKLVTQIVEVIGALPEALYDGTLQIRYKWEINTDQYDAVGSPDQIYTDVQDNLSASEQTQPFELFNKFRIREGNGVFSDVIEFFDNDEEDGGNTLAGILRAYPNPWRLNVRIIQTNDGPLPLNYVGVVQREETQLVEFKEGEASVTYPIVSVDSIDWKSYNLGSLVHEDHGRELTAPTDVNYGYGLAEITYTTEAIEYTTSAPFATDAQFLLQDEG